MYVVAAHDVHVSVSGDSSLPVSEVVNWSFLGVICVYIFCYYFLHFCFLQEPTLADSINTDTLSFQDVKTSTPNDDVIPEQEEKEFDDEEQKVEGEQENVDEEQEADEEQTSK